MSRPASAHVLITCRQLQSRLDHHASWLAAHGITVEAPEVVQHLGEADLLPIIHRFDGAIVGDDQLTRPVIEAGTRLKVICKWGVGVDAIDLAAAKERGIPVHNTPGMFGDEVADVAMGYIILLARGLHRIDRSVREGGWLKIRGTTLAGKRIGVIGLGSIGRAVVSRAIGFGLLPLGSDPHQPPDPDFDTQTGLRRMALDDLIPQADFLVIACNLTPETHHLLDADRLSHVKPGAFVVNVSRGPVIDEAALVRALRDGRLAGAGLDVFETEPLPTDSALRGFETVVLGSHNGSNTVEGVERVNAAALEILVRGLGFPLRTPPE